MSHEVSDTADTWNIEDVFLLVPFLEISSIVVLIGCDDARVQISEGLASSISTCV